MCLICFATTTCEAWGYEVLISIEFSLVDSVQS